MVSIDWLSFSVTLALSPEEKRAGAVLACPPGCSLVELGGTNIYKRRVLVLDDGGNKVLTLLLNPYSKVIPADSMFCEVGNRWLYSSLDWVLPFVFSIHEGSFLSLSRLDICCDFNPDVAQMFCIESLQTGAVYVAGKREGSMFYDYHLPPDGGKQERVARCLSWGSKCSNIKWKLYNKSLEMYEVVEGKKWCNKPWIEECWKKEGLDVDNVWRLEVSITSAAGYDFHGDKLAWWITSPEAYLRLFWDMVDTRFVIRANQGHKCRKWDEIIDFLVRPADLGGAYRLRQRVGDGISMHTDHAATLRAAIQQLERPEVICYPVMRDIWLNTAESVVCAGRLDAYFLNTYGKTFEVYRDELINR